MPISNLITKYGKNSASVVHIDTLVCPVGKVIAAADNDFLYCVTFEDSKNFAKNFEVLAEELSCKFVLSKNIILERFQEELSAYFEGNLKKFTVPVKMFGTEFQKIVWNKLLELPYGSTQTYGDLAKTIGRPPSHSRAVGAACGANALLLVVPCHRLVASGTKGGYNSGVDRKDKLIELEQKYSAIN